MQRNGWMHSIDPNALEQPFSYQVKPIVIPFSLKNNDSTDLYSGCSHQGPAETSEIQLKDQGKQPK